MDQPLKIADLIVVGLVGGALIYMGWHRAFEGLVLALFLVTEYGRRMAINGVTRSMRAMLGELERLRARVDDLE